MKSETLLNYFDKYSKEQILSSTEFILQTAQRMNDIIKNFLDLYAIEQGTISIEKTHFDLGEMLEQVIEEYNPRAAAKNIVISYEEYSPTGQLMSDKTLIRQIVDNLISNAVKYTPQKKNIYVRLKAITAHTYRSSQSGTAQVNDSVIALRVEVQDEGEGILAHQIPLVFERFAHIGTRPTGGETTTGLGLSIARKLALLINAHIWCESEFQQGSTFFLEIPVDAQ
jgi:signal transduction histidine kinase